MEVVWVLFAVAALAALFFALQWNNLRQVKAPASNAPVLEKKIEELRAELAGAKEEAAKRQRLLDEAREEARKRLRREGKKAERPAAELEQKMTSDPRDVEIQGLKKGLASLESQLNAAKQEVERKAAELERLTGSARGEADDAHKARDAERAKGESLLEENHALKRTLDELRAAKRKESDRPDVPGSSLDLKALPPDAVQELARYFRKGEEFERLYAVAQGQLQLHQDRNQELQRRYFAVCRELALAAGTKPVSDDEARHLAEAAVAGSDNAARSAPGASPEGGAVAGAPGDAPKKRRRRRRRRKPGAPGEAGVAAEGAAAEGGAEAAADGDEGDDDGDEGADDAGDDSRSNGDASGGAAPAPASA